MIVVSNESMYVVELDVVVVVSVSKCVAEAGVLRMSKGSTGSMESEKRHGRRGGLCTGKMGTAPEPQLWHRGTKIHSE